MSWLKSLPRAAPDGLIAAVLLSFLATAGLFYVNIMPAIIEGLTRGLGLTTREAGLIASANVYGAAVGALAAACLIRRWPWRPTTTALLIALMSLDLSSIELESAGALILLRALHGVVGGSLVGFAFGVIARTLRPERTFGMLLLVQFGLGGLGVMFLPQLAVAHGTWVLFVSLFAFSAVALLMAPWLDDYSPRQRIVTAGATRSIKLSLPLILALLAVCLFQAANMALFSFILGLGRHSGLDDTFAAQAVGSATWIGMAGSVLVMALSIRVGRVAPLIVALTLTAIGFWILHYASSKTLFVLANCGTGITWAFVMPYLLGMCAEFDEGGQTAALGGFASKMGLASGPLLGAMLLGEERYDLLINMSGAGILLCMIIVFVPARILDAHRKPT